MCYFITSIFPKKVQIENLNRIGEKFGLQFEICNNEFIQKQLNQDERYIAKCSESCDCDTVLGIFNKKNKTIRAQTEQIEINKLRQKAWSETKIQRFLTEKNKKEDQNKKTTEKEFQQWIDFIENLFVELKINNFGILLHWYNGSVDDEQFYIQERKNVNLSIQMLSEIEEDKLYVVKPVFTQDTV